MIFSALLIFPILGNINCAAVGGLHTVIAIPNTANVNTIGSDISTLASSGNSQVKPDSPIHSFASNSNNLQVQNQFRESSEVPSEDSTDRYLDTLNSDSNASPSNDEPNSSVDEDKNPEENQNKNPVDDSSSNDNVAVGGDFHDQINILLQIANVPAAAHNISDKIDTCTPECGLGPQLACPESGDCGIDSKCCFDTCRHRQVCSKSDGQEATTDSVNHRKKRQDDGLVPNKPSHSNPEPRNDDDFIPSQPDIYSSHDYYKFPSLPYSSDDSAFDKSDNVNDATIFPEDTENSYSGLDKNSYNPDDGSVKYSFPSEPNSVEENSLDSYQPSDIYKSYDADTYIHDTYLPFENPLIHESSDTDASDTYASDAYIRSDTYKPFDTYDVPSDQAELISYASDGKYYTQRGYPVHDDNDVIFNHEGANPNSDGGVFESDYNGRFSNDHQNVYSEDSDSYNGNAYSRNYRSDNLGSSYTGYSENSDSNYDVNADSDVYHIENLNLVDPEDVVDIEYDYPDWPQEYMANRGHENNKGFLGRIFEKLG